MQIMQIPICVNHQHMRQQHERIVNFAEKMSVSGKVVIIIVSHVIIRIPIQQNKKNAICVITDIGGRIITVLIVIQMIIKVD